MKRANSKSDWCSNTSINYRPGRHRYGQVEDLAWSLVLGYQFTLTDFQAALGVTLRTTSIPGLVPSSIFGHEDLYSLDSADQFIVFLKTTRCKQTFVYEFELTIARALLELSDG